MAEIWLTSRVQVLTKDGAPVSKFGDSGSEQLHYPQGCVFHKDIFIVSDWRSKCLKMFDSSGSFCARLEKKVKRMDSLKIRVDYA